MRTALIATLCVGLGLATFAHPSQGQSDWLKKGKGLLENLTGGSGGGTTASLTTSEIQDGLKEALRVGTETVVAQLGKADGFNADQSVHIPLPDSLKTVQKSLKRVGLSSMMDDLEVRLNRAAEAATPKAKQLFWDAIRDMSVSDVRAIYDGPDDAATRYFQSKMSQPLKMEMKPVVDQSLSQVGAIQTYENAMGQYRSIPFVPDVKADLTNHVLDAALKGIFHYLAIEEAAIRREPVKRTTEILKKVFGSS
jgi:hypothetical protein